jgi:hypothetical protein
MDHRHPVLSHSQWSLSPVLEKCPAYFVSPTLPLSSIPPTLQQDTRPAGWAAGIEKAAFREFVQLSISSKLPEGAVN